MAQGWTFLKMDLRAGGSDEATGRQEDPLGVISRLWPGFAKRLHDPTNWLSIIGLVGVAELK